MAISTFPRTYRMMIGQRVSMLVIAALIMGVGAAGWFFGVGQSSLYDLSMIGILLFSAVFVLGGIFMFGYFLVPSAVTLNRNSIELSSLISDREFFISDLAGYKRRRRIFGKNAITLISADPRDKATNVPGYLQSDYIFDAWLLSLRNLEQVDDEQALDNIPRKTAPSLDIEEKSHRSGGGVALALNAAGAFISVFGLVLSDPSGELLLILAAAPWVAVMMMIVRPAHFRLDFRGDGTRRSLVFLFILPGIALAARANSDMELAGWEMPVAAAAVVALLIAVISRAAYRGSSEVGYRVAVLFVLMLPYGFGLTLAINSRFDTSVAQVFPVTVQDKNYSGGSGQYSLGRFWVELGPWGERSTESSITVPGRV